MRHIEILDMQSLKFWECYKYININIKKIYKGIKIYVKQVELFILTKISCF